MSNNSNHFAEAAMLIRKPVNQVFQAFIDPEITSRFWFTDSSGKLVEGESVEWYWEMYNHAVEVEVKSITPNEAIIIEWGSPGPTSIVKWTFKSLGENKTFVTIVNDGLSGSSDELISNVRDLTGGFTWVLAGLKAYLEHGIELNLIADRFPAELND